MNDRKINILFIIPSLQIGGAERQVVDLVNGLDKDRFNVHLFTFEKQLDLFEALSREKISFTNSPRRHKFDTAPIFKIAQIIDGEKIDIIHCTLQIALLFGFLGKLRAKKKVKLVSALHTTINRDFKGELFDWFLYAPLMSSCHRVITVCQNQKIHWSRKYPFLKNRFLTIYNGIDTEKFKETLSAEDKKKLKESLGIQEEEFTALMVAGLRREKGHEYAFEALRALLDAGEKAKLLLVGDGERKNHLLRLSRRLSLSRNLIWLGYRKDPREYLSISDVLLVPSVAESFPMAILEALAMGKPVIASRVGGTSEVIREGVNGFLVEPRDTRSLMEKLKMLIHDENARGRLARNARESVINDFSVSGMIQKTEAVLARLLNS